jgi:hypothetical protein
MVQADRRIAGDLGAIVIFFKPSNKFVAWLIGYAGDRIIYDCGCGDAHLLRLLLDGGAKAMGIELLWAAREGYDPMLPVLPLGVDRCSGIREHAALIIIARPDHGGWAAGIESFAHPDSEILYISKPENVQVDFPLHDLQLVKSPACPVEKVYRVTRKAKTVKRKPSKSKKRPAPPRDDRELYALIRIPGWDHPTWMVDTGRRYENQAGGGFGKDDMKIEVFETQMTDDYQQLDHTKTAIFLGVNPDSMDGWCAPDGKFFPCTYADHDAYAYLILKKEVSELEKDGWARCHSRGGGEKSPWFWHGDGGKFDRRLTAEQRNTLSKRGFIVEDWC